MAKLDYSMAKSGLQQVCTRVVDVSVLLDGRHGIALLAKARRRNINAILVMWVSSGGNLLNKEEKCV